ncbi:hypothetical protein [Modestobacter excelsi]|nr:hypothetical protein [Modestobacter excelsi]
MGIARSCSLRSPTGKGSVATRIVTWSFAGWCGVFDLALGVGLLLLV